MGCAHNSIYCHRLHKFTISFLILLISSSSKLRLFTAEGRQLAESDDNAKTVNEEKAILKAQIGSRPPRCHRRCASCGHCEAIQVPTNPQITSGRRNSTAAAAAAAVPVIAYARGDDNSNYKAMSWKCKCGNLIFNP